MSGPDSDERSPASPGERKRFAHIAGAGITFQAGSALVDSATIMSALVHQLTGSPVAVGAATAILRFGWLSPQLFIGFLAEKHASSMRYYAAGGFGRVACLMVLSLVLIAGSEWSHGKLAAAVLALWTAYAFVSGIVAVPYNDVVARSVASERRSRLLATRFFGGGMLALGLAAVADMLLGQLPFPQSYAALIALASGMMLVSATVFVTAGEPSSHEARGKTGTFAGYLREGMTTLRTDRRFARFVLAQWCGGGVLMALPFYVVQAAESGFAMAEIAWLLGAQTTGALSSNALWGWWGDRRGKNSLLGSVALGRVAPPAMVFLPVVVGDLTAPILFAWYVAIFFVLGALANGLTIAVIGYLMEISPEDRRPSYSGYFNALTAPAFLLPLLGGAIASTFGLSIVFALSLAAAMAQYLLVRLAAAAGRTPA